MRTRERAAPGAIPAFGEPPTPCHGAYRVSNPTRQMSFRDPRELHGEAVCARSGLVGESSGADRVEARGGREEERPEREERA